MRVIILALCGYCFGGLACGALAYYVLRRMSRRLFPDSAMAVRYRQDVAESANALRPTLAPCARWLKRREDRYAFIRKRVADYDQRILEAGGFWHGLTGYEVLSAQFTFAFLAPCLLFLSGVVFIVGPLVFVMSALLIAFVAYAYPASMLEAKAIRRQEEFVRQLPSALDILRVGAEAGLDFHTATRYLMDIYLPGPVKEEMTVFQRDLLLGRSASEALNGIAARINLPEVSAVFVSLAQSIEMGTSATTMLGATASEMRRKRVLQAQAEAQKAIVKITFPLLLLILPGVFIVLLGPIIKTLLNSWSFM